MHLLKEKVLKEQLEANIFSDINSGKVGGAAIAVTQDGKTVYQEPLKGSGLSVKK